MKYALRKETEIKNLCTRNIINLSLKVWLGEMLACFTIDDTEDQNFFHFISSIKFKAPKQKEKLSAILEMQILLDSSYNERHPVQKVIICFQHDKT